MSETVFSPINQRDTEKFHTGIENGNLHRCVKIRKEWESSRDWPSSQAISILHSTLFEGIPQYARKGMVPLSPGCYRKDDIRVTGEPENFYVHGLDVSPVMYDYCKRLDEMLRDLPSNPSCHVGEIISQAAWAYYTFIRIHPFLDGNGRIGRMIMQRVLKGRGFRNVIFSQQPSSMNRKNEENRDRHLDVMNQVDRTGNLAYLELYIAELLLPRYMSNDNEGINGELKNLIFLKKHEIRSQRQKRNLAQIWSIFGGLDIYS